MSFCFRTGVNVYHLAKMVSAFIYFIMGLSRLGQWEPLNTGSYVFLLCPCHSLKASLLCSTKRFYRLILCFSYLTPGVSHFSRKPWFHLVGKGIWICQDLSIKFAYCYYSIIASRPTQAELRNICICYILTQIYISVSLCIF